MIRYARVVAARMRGLLLVVAGLTVAMLNMAPGCAMSESPMAFSPDGRQLVLTTLEPLKTDRTDLPAGEQVFRLMDIEGRDLKVLEEATDALLTAPGYSPDGRRIAYLRFGLLPAEQKAAQSQASETRLKPLESIANLAWGRWWSEGGQPEPPQAQPAEGIATQDAAQAPATQPAIDLVDAAAPPVTGATGALLNSVFLPDVTAELVVRDLRTGQVVSRMPIPLPGVDHDMIYAFTRPQFGPEGQWVYFGAQHFVLAVNVTTGQKRILAGQNVVARLSPDGRTIATLVMPAGEGSIIVGFVSIDGDLAVYRRLPEDIEVSIPFWLDDQTVLLGGLQPAAADSQPVATQTAPAEQAKVLVLHRIRRDGTLLEPIRIVLPQDEIPAQAQASGFALARDGRHFVYGYQGAILFGTLDGRIVSRWRGDEKVILEEPVFSPDSQRVAFKVSRELHEKTRRVEAVAFFSNQGRELYRVAVPPIDPATTRPAAPQTQPSDAAER